jgi:hypothetical protein
VTREKSWPYETEYAACAAALCASEPMKERRRSPPMFIAIPWIPAGSPKRKRERMMAPSGPNPRARGKRTTHPPRQSFHIE